MCSVRGGQHQSLADTMRAHALFSNAMLKCLQVRSRRSELAVGVNGVGLFLHYFLHSSLEVKFNYSLVLSWVLARFHLEYVSIYQFKNIANYDERNPESFDLMLGKLFWFSSISMIR